MPNPATSGKLAPGNPHSCDFDTDQKLAERHAAAMNKTALDHTDLQPWASAARVYRARPDSGPAIRALEGSVGGIPRLGWVAQLESTEEAERVLLAAGFRFIPEEKEFKAWSGAVPARLAGLHFPARVNPAGKSARLTIHGSASSSLTLLFLARLHLPSQLIKNTALGKSFFTPSRNRR
jgi:hypothetical protein